MNCPISGKPCLKLKYIGVTATMPDGSEQEHLVCQDCTHKANRVHLSADGKSCRRCGMPLSQIIKGSRFGCSACYDEFNDTVPYVISSLQRANDDVRHVGRVPSGFLMDLAEKTTESGLVEELEGEMLKACSEEDYERADRIKSKLKELEGMKKGESIPSEELALFVFKYLVEESEGLQ